MCSKESAELRYLDLPLLAANFYFDGSLCKYFVDPALR